MRTAIVSLVVFVIAGLSALAIERNHFSTEAPGPAGLAPVPLAARPPEAAALPSPTGTLTNNVEPAPATAQHQDTPEKRQEIGALYKTAGKISSAAERDKEYAILVGYATGAGDFELAIEITSGISAAGVRDNNYAKIVQQAMTVGDAAAADKAAEKISSVILRDEQFRKIAASCPSNTTTEETASILGLESENRAGPIQRSDRGRRTREVR